MLKMASLSMLDAWSKALWEEYHGMSNSVRINRGFLFMEKIKAARVQWDTDNQRRDERACNESLLRD